VFSRLQAGVFSTLKFAKYCNRYLTYPQKLALSRARRGLPRCTVENGGLAGKSLISLTPQAMPRNRARPLQALWIKPLARSVAGFPQSYPQDAWTFAKSLLNHGLSSSV
jgi:hypothetical protein